MAHPRTRPQPRSSALARLLTCIALLGASTGCKASLPYVWVNDLPRTQDVQRIQPGDKISVLVRNQQPLSGEFEVRPGGTYNQPVLGEIPVAGLTPEEAATELARLLKGVVVEPLAAVSILQTRTIRVGLLGEIRTPGMVDVPQSTSVLDLLARAGELSEFADPDSIFVLRRYPRLVRIRFRYRDLVGGDPRSVEFRLRDGDNLIAE
jgi:polysaccharide export outer membrane protein